ncbi:MAG: hypothetical protein ACOH5I_07030 [Oligoflexus sp.]
MERKYVNFGFAWILAFMSLGISCKTLETSSELKAMKVDLLAMDIFEVTLVEGNKARKFELDVTSYEFLKSEFQEKQWSEAISTILTDKQMNEVMKNLATIEETPYPLCASCEDNKQSIYLNVFHEEMKFTYFSSADQCICPQHTTKRWKTIAFPTAMSLFQNLAKF